MTRDDTTLSNEIDTLIEERPAYELDENEKQMNANQRFEYAVVQLEGHRIRITNSMRELALLLSLIDEDIALLQSIKLKSKGEAQQT